ncbi:colanic acid biosynthesis glycosyl transferase WcaI [Frankia sp. Hr75.2]|uniref:glycosyltransferase family 4 protein n=1 Tax=Parafrankia sp. Ea1.12 TaxID=573499 RepID=UPI000DA47BD9|nr:glycosyltransferase family 4 protein [Parafrankia sp. Ea1.12]CAI7976894.1 colanic acid biosynthesis glycosyl transferase WcaI [Frankia sp. Hr75.2]SQD97045.1 Glycosyl transferase group 1 [Parafrankia sp. Ea1.12]
MPRDSFRIPRRIIVPSRAAPVDSPTVRGGPGHAQTGGPARGRAPRVLLVTHYFPPETGAPQARLSETARAWTADGLDVTVLTGIPNHPTGIVPEAYRRVVRRLEQGDGYRIVRTWLYATPNEGVVRKTLGHLSFMASSVVFGARAAGPADVVVVSSPTFFSLGSAWILARLRRARLVVEVRDLWPAIFVQLGVITSPRIIAALERLELAAYHAADAVVTVTEGFRADITRRGIPAAKVHTIPNGVDLARFRPGVAAPAGLRERLGAGPDDVVVLYLGAHGISQGLTTIADAAAVVAERGVPVRFAFVGEGADKRRLAAHVAQLGLTNTTLLPGVRRDEVPGLLAAADICLVPLRDVPLFETFIPSKMFEMLAAGRPVIGSVRGEAARILMDAGARVVPPENAIALADAVIEMAGDPDRRAAMGRAGRAHVEAHFDREVLARRYRDLILSLLPDAGGRPGSVPPQVSRTRVGPQMTRPSTTMRNR